MTTFFGSYERARNRFPLVRTNSSFVTVREGDTDTFASLPASSPAPRGNFGNNGCSGEGRKPRFGSGDKQRLTVAGLAQARLVARILRMFSMASSRVAVRPWLERSHSWQA